MGAGKGGREDCLLVIRQKESERVRVRETACAYFMGQDCMTLWVQNMRHAAKSGRTVFTAPSWHTPWRTDMLLYEQNCEYVFERVPLCACVFMWVCKRGREWLKKRITAKKDQASSLFEACHPNPLAARCSLTHMHTHTHSESAGVCFVLFRIYWRACRAPSQWLRSWKANWTTWCGTPETWAHNQTGSLRLSDSTTGERSPSTVVTLCGGKHLKMSQYCHS